MKLKYRIELRQRDVTGLNARHYFWVKKIVLPSGRSIYLEEMHGFARDPETGKPLPFSVGGDPLGFFIAIRPSRHYRQSLTLPHAIALEGSRESIETHWDAGRHMGEFVHSKRLNYFPLGNNSNAMATTIGNAMGLRPHKILDPRMGGEAVQPFTPGLGRDLSKGHADAPWQPTPDLITDVGGFGQLDRIDGAAQMLDPFADPFRDDIPL